MAGMLFPDIAGALSSGAQAGAASAQGRFLMEDRAAKNEIAPLIPKALQGDREALDQIGARHPDTLMKITPLLERADAATRARAKETAEWTTKAAMGVLSLPEAERPAAYQAALADGQRLGYKIDMPPQYDRAVEGRLRMVVNQARSVSDFLKSQGEGVTFAPPAGGGEAASGDVIGRTKQAIGGMESGNRYDAVGPDTGSGKRAYGKYQVMDFNIGPWTQEALGRALTPQEFLASPQAQEAVAEFKLGQYIKQYGSPEAAARAWFAGAGGMNNPGAKDVLGTSVQGYGQKFAQAFGPGATGPGPQIAQGDNTRADGSGTPLPPAQQALAPLRGLQIPPGARVALQGGIPIVKDGNVLYIDANGAWGAAPLPSRAVPKERQAPAGYEFTPEGGLAPIPGGPADPARQRAERVPQGYRLGADGQSLEFIPGGPADPAIAKKAQPMTEGQANAALYADRMRAAEKVILANESAGQSALGKGLELVPGGNYLQSEGYQLYEQARRDFINAVLRRESGAVISDAEFANAEKQYFPRPGDKPDVLKQKAENRRIAIEGISRAAGSTYKPAAETPAAPAPGPAAAPAPAPQQPAPQTPRGADRGKLLFDARDAIAKGAPRDKVIERLRSMGIEDEP